MSRKHQFAIVHQNGTVECEGDDIESLHAENNDYHNGQAIVVDAGRPIVWPDYVYVQGDRVALHP